jgi:hypothetical protein
MKAAALLIALALSGCATVPPAYAGPTAGIGQTAYTNGLRVRPLQVLEDSRCPQNARCIWAGRLIVRSEVMGGSWHRTLDLELGKPQHVADGSLTLVGGSPEKTAGVESDPRSYRFTFDFQGGI